MAIGSFIRDLLWSARRPNVFRRCALIALVVGTLLNLVNQIDALVAGRGDLALLARILGNYFIPFVVSNLGAMGASGERQGPRSAR